ncbi:hypothetical protein [Rhizobium sp. CF142]|uniref:hypothetical protein n=1 Tax=Rhizobium sp. CF142 TaxID=1144314 RepID=UPI00056151D8|nr:hypothetical protein [Rhizobium sp. CF142]
MIGIAAALLATLLDPINWVMAFLVFLFTGWSERKVRFLAVAIVLSTIATVLIGSAIVRYQIYKDNEIDHSFNLFDDAHVNQIIDLDGEEFVDVFSENVFQAKKSYLETRDKDCRVIWNAFLDKGDSSAAVGRVCSVGHAAVTAASQLILVGVAMTLAGRIARRRISR